MPAPLVMGGPLAALMLLATALWRQKPPPHAHWLYGCADAAHAAMIAIAGFMTVLLGISALKHEFRQALACLNPHVKVSRYESTEACVRDWNLFEHVGWRKQAKAVIQLAVALTCALLITGVCIPALVLAIIFNPRVQSVIGFYQSGDRWFNVCQIVHGGLARNWRLRLSSFETFTGSSSWHLGLLSQPLGFATKLTSAIIGGLHISAPLFLQYVCWWGGYILPFTPYSITFGLLIFKAFRRLIASIGTELTGVPFALYPVICLAFPLQVLSSFLAVHGSVDAVRNLTAFSTAELTVSAAVMTSLFMQYEDLATRQLVRLFGPLLHANFVLSDPTGYQWHGSSAALREHLSFEYVITSTVTFFRWITCCAVAVAVWWSSRRRSTARVNFLLVAPLRPMEASSSTLGDAATTLSDSEDNCKLNPNSGADARNSDQDHLGRLVEEPTSDASDNFGSDVNTASHVRVWRASLSTFGSLYRGANDAEHLLPQRRSVG